MTSMAIRQETRLVKFYNGTLYKNLLIFGAAGGTLLGILCSLIGIFLSIEIFAMQFETHRLEVVFLGSSFGLFALAAHCLDKIEQLRKNKRIKRSHHYQTPKKHKN